MSVVQTFYDYFLLVIEAEGTTPDYQIKKDFIKWRANTRKRPLSRSRSVKKYVDIENVVDFWSQFFQHPTVSLTSKSRPLPGVPCQNSGTEKLH